MASVFDGYPESLSRATWDPGMVAGGEIRKALPEAPQLKPLEGEQTSVPFAGADPQWPLPGTVSGCSTVWGSAEHLPGKSTVFVDVCVKMGSDSDMSDMLMEENHGTPPYFLL